MTFEPLLLAIFGVTPVGVIIPLEFEKPDDDVLELELDEVDDDVEEAELFCELSGVFEPTQANMLMLKRNTQAMFLMKTPKISLTEYSYYQMNIFLAIIILFY